MTVPCRESRPLRVLVADDEPDTAESTAELLTLHGCVVATAFGGEEAVRLAAADRPDVILLDLQMPCTDGYEVARRILGGVGRPPVMVGITCSGRPAERQRGVEAGLDLQLLKPVEPAFLVGVVDGFRETLLNLPDPPH